MRHLRVSRLHCLELSLQYLLGNRQLHFNHLHLPLLLLAQLHPPHHHPRHLLPDCHLLQCGRPLLHPHLHLRLLLLLRRQLHRMQMELQLLQ